MNQLFPHEGLQYTYFCKTSVKRPRPITYQFFLLYVNFYLTSASFEKELLSYILAEIVMLGFVHFPA